MALMATQCAIIAIAWEFRVQIQVGTSKSSKILLGTGNTVAVVLFIVRLLESLEGSFMVV